MVDERFGEGGLEAGLGGMATGDEQAQGGAFAAVEAGKGVGIGAGGE